MKEREMNLVDSDIKNKIFYNREVIINDIAYFNYEDA